ncbi:MAG: putative Sensor histidine kinase [Nitrospira sp.]|jgi:PAS domain S-box-containing protein|nr:putative Sensor histidine kinase [Nitrospira sp.]
MVMPEGAGSKEPPSRFLHGLARLGLIGVLTGAIFLLDSMAPSGIPVWILYLVPLVLTYQAPYYWTPPVTALFCATLTSLDYLVSPHLEGVPSWIPLINRSVSLGVFALIAYLIVQQKRMTQELIKAAILEVEHEALQHRERLLLKNAEEVEDLYDRAPCGYHSLNPHGLIIAVNQTELDWLGYTRHDIVGKKPILELLTPTSAQLFHERFPRFIKDGHIHDLELDMVRKDGTILPVLLNATALRDAEGRFIASRSTLLDITERRKADEALRLSHNALEDDVRQRTAELRIANEQLERQLAQSKRTQAALSISENRFRLMANSAPVLIWISDTTKTCTWFNKPWLEFVGHRLEEESGNGWSRHIHPDDLDSRLKVYESSFEARQEFKIEYRLRRHDGQWRWLLDHGLPRYEADEVFAGFIGSCIDITEHKDALLAARESEERLSGIIGSAMDAIITVNERQEITHFNVSAETMFACKAEAALSRPIAKFIPEWFRAARKNPAEASGRTAVGRPQMGELNSIYGFRMNGEQFPIEASVSQVRARGQKLFTVILRDVSQRKQAEDALKASEARFRELLECLPQLVWTCLPEGSCDYLSPQWVAYTGVPEGVQLGTGWFQQLHSEDRQATVDGWNAAVLGGHPFEHEFRIRRKDGAYRWFHARATPLRDGNGRLIKWLGTNMDIHDRKRAEDVQARLGAIVESSSDAIISQGLDGLVLTWNLSAEQMFGYLADEIVGRPIGQIVPRDQRQEEWTLFEEVKAGKQHRQHEAVRARKDATYLYVSLTISPIKDAAGTVIGISTIARDITARKRAEETMNQQRKLLELSYEPIFAWDMQSGIVEWNRGCEQLYGYTKSDALQKMSHRLLNTTFPCPLSDIQAALESTGEWAGEIHQRTKDGQEVLVESRLGLLKSDGRSLVLETNRDITERRRFEVMLLKKNRDLETLLYVTSHDLKEPLRAIESFSLLLQERYADRLDEKGRDFLMRIVRATQRLDQLLTDILDLSRAQRMDPPVEEVEAELLVQEVLRRLETRIKDTHARITIRSPLPRMLVNRTWAIQGIYNLVSNALKFARHGEPPEVEIDSYRKQEPEGHCMLGLIVRDRGPGVSPDQRERIFELFRRAVGREIEGTGAGLAIVRQVAERHGGRAWVVSREQGGSEFYITFGTAQNLSTKV